MADDVVPMGRPDPDPTVLTTANLLREIEHLEKLVNQRLDAEERNRVEQKSDMKAALDAALAAAKEAVKEQTIASEKSIEKSEAYTSKQIEEQGRTFSSDIDNLKERVGKIENVRIGSRETVALIALLAGIVGTLLATGVFR